VPAPQRTARIEDEIWNPAQARAQAEGASLGALMRAAIFIASGSAALLDISGLVYAATR
jgi:hypothetical protein